MRDEHRLNLGKDEVELVSVELIQLCGGSPSTVQQYGTAGTENTEKMGRLELHVQYGK